MFEVINTLLPLVRETGCFFFSYYYSGHLPEGSDMLHKEEMVRLKRCIFSLQRNGLPPITTHNVVDDWNDPVLNSIRRCNLFNTTHDRVKVYFAAVLIDSISELN